MSFTEFRDWLWVVWPESPHNVLDRLRHTLDVYDSPLLTDDGDTIPEDDDLAIHATGGMYPNQVTTGLTWGDLRSIRRYLDQQWTAYEQMGLLVRRDRP